MAASNVKEVPKGVVAAAAIRILIVPPLAATVTSSMLVTVYIDAASADPRESSIINLLQQLSGLLPMPILSAIVAGLLFRNIEARAAIGWAVWGVLL